MFCKIPFRQTVHDLEKNLLPPFHDLLPDNLEESIGL